MGGFVYTLAAYVGRYTVLEAHLRERRRFRCLAAVMAVGRTVAALPVFQLASCTVFLCYSRLRSPIKSLYIPRALRNAARPAHAARQYFYMPRARDGSSPFIYLKKNQEERHFFDLFFFSKKK